MRARDSRGLDGIDEGAESPLDLPRGGPRVSERHASLGTWGNGLTPQLLRNADEGTE
jgi:hypothetical protein